MKTRLLTILLLSVSAFATTPVTGHIANLNTGTPGTSGFVRFILGGMGGNQPRITGTGAIAPLQGGNGLFYVDLPADASGNVSGTIYSTRDAAGTGNGEIEVGGSYTAVYYRMFVYNNGIPGPEIRVHANNGVSLDISNVTPISTAPVVTAPTGDTTYCRIDGGNCGFTGPITSTSSISPKDLITSSTPVVDVRSKGAACNGVADDTTAILAAITAASGKTVYLPPGVCTFTAQLALLDAGACVNIIGAGRDISTLKLTSAIGTPALFKGAASTPQGCVYKDFTVDANALAPQAIEMLAGRDYYLADLGGYNGTTENFAFGDNSHTGGIEFFEANAFGLFAWNNAALFAGAGPSYGFHFYKGTSDSHFYGLDQRMSNTATLEVEGSNIEFHGYHGYGSWPGANKTPDYTVEDSGGHNRYFGVECDGAQVSCLHAASNFLTFNGVGIIVPDSTSFVATNVATIDSGKAGLIFDNVQCLDSNMVAGAAFSGDTSGVQVAHGFNNCPFQAESNLARFHQFGSFIAHAAGQSSPYMNFYGLGTSAPVFGIFSSSPTKNYLDIGVASGTPYVSVTPTGTVALNSLGTSGSGNYQLTVQDSSTVNNVKAGFFAADGGSGSAIYGFDPTAVAGQLSTFRLCRNTNNAGGCSFNQFKGDGTSTVTASIDNNGMASFAGGLNMATQNSSFLKIRDQGSCTMTTGTCSAQSLGHTYSAAPNCFANWNNTGTLTGILKVPSTTTTVTPASSVGTDTAVVNWFCVGS